MIPLHKIKFICLVLSVVTIFSSCKKFVEIDPPRTELITPTVFATDETAKAAMNDVYIQMRNSFGFAGGGFVGISCLASLSADESVAYFQGDPASTQDYKEFSDNSLTPDNTWVLGLWTDLYNCIYKANAVLEGLTTSTGISAGTKKQLTGEAKFIRAFCHFYLTNLWGDVLLITTTDYRVNNTMPRSPKAQVYQQIIADLKDAQNLLPDDYSFSANARVRVNKSVATALLARAYLYTEDWVNAEMQASTLIN
jgi:hypothetical protein